MRTILKCLLIKPKANHIKSFQKMCMRCYLKEIRAKRRIYLLWLRCMITLEMNNSKSWVSYKQSVLKKILALNNLYKSWWIQIFYNNSLTLTRYLEKWCSVHPQSSSIHRSILIWLIINLIWRIIKYQGTKLLLF